MKRTAGEVCVEYALAAQAVREQTRIIRENRCPEESPEERDERGMVINPARPSCLSDHWTMVCTPYGEEPLLAEEEMCDSCKVRLAAFIARKAHKKRLGVLKRAVESAGKRLLSSQIGGAA